MNKDQIKGRVEQAKEHVKEASGKIVVNDTSMLSLSSPFRMAGEIFAACTRHRAMARFSAGKSGCLCGRPTHFP